MSARASLAITDSEEAIEIPNLRTSAQGADRNNMRQYLEKVSSKLPACSCAAVDRGCIGDATVWLDTLYDDSSPRLN